MTEFPRTASRRRTIQAVVFCLAALVTASQPGTAGASDRDYRLRSALEAARMQYGFPGATAAFALRDGTVGVAATGVADIEAGTLMTPRSRMLAASIGKTFVAATAVALAMEGTLDLDAPLSRWLGERAWYARLPNHDAITLRHLLTHSAGLPNHVHLAQFASQLARRWRGRDNPFTPGELIGFVLDRPPLFHAGKGWAYTDTGYVLVGLVIEAATGKTYYDVIRDRFLVPLALTQTDPSDRRLLPGLAAGYTSKDNAFGFPRKTTDDDGRLLWHPGLEWTGGGLVSTSRDLARWGAALFGGSAMPGAYLNELLHSVPVDSANPDIRYGAGVAIYRSGPFGTVYGHGGWIAGYISSLRYYANHGIVIAFQINTDIGIAGPSAPAIRDIEARLAEAILSTGQDSGDRGKTRGIVKQVLNISSLAPITSMSPKQFHAFSLRENALFSRVP